MVCAKGGAWGRSAPAIAGGFVAIPVGSLMAAWRACRARPLGVGDFRAWLAAREMVARRCTLGEAREADYSPGELASLLGVARRRASASLRRLEAAGLLEWSPSTLGFPEGPPGPVDPGLADTIGRGSGAVIIPRRVLRRLARGARPALIATALGVLLRCLARRRAGFDGRGRLKASWVAGAFGVDLRRVKQARKDLVGLGWIAGIPSPPWAARRWGAAYAIDLGWGEGPEAGAPSPPGPARSMSATATPRSDREPLREGIQDQEPGGARPAGIRIPGQGGGGPGPTGSPPLPSPRIDDVRPEDLKETARLLGLHGQAVARGLVTASEADRLRFVAAAEHALAIGRANPPGLFAHLVRGRCWRFATAEDEDRASRRLRAHDRGLTPTPSLAPSRSCSASPRPRPPSDAEIVRAVRAAAIRAGIFRDPFPEFARRYPGWCRGRWDRALAGLSPPTPR